MYEYKVVPAPTRGQKAHGVKGAEARFAYALEQVMNQHGAEGWDYVRAETLPSEERQGLTGTATHYRNVLVFRRAVAVADPVETPPLLPMPDPVSDPAPSDPPLTAKKDDEAETEDEDTAGDSPEEDSAASDEGAADDGEDTADASKDDDQKPA